MIVFIPYMGTDYLFFKVGESDFIAELCLSMKQHQQTVQVINLNETYAGSWGEQTRLLKDQLSVLAVHQMAAKEYCLSGKTGTNLDIFLDRMDLRALQHKGHKVIVYFQTCFKENVYTHLACLRALKMQNADLIIVCCGTYFQVNRKLLLQEYRFIDYIPSGAADSLLEIGQKHEPSNVTDLALVEGSEQHQDQRCVDYTDVFAKGEVVPFKFFRGCPYHCFFCESQEPLSPLGTKELDALLYQVQFNVAKGFPHFWVQDSGINFREEILRQFCDRLISGNHEAFWSASIVPFSMQPSTYQLMYKAGCRHLRVGAESVNSKTLASFGKNMSRESITDALREASLCGIKNSLTFMLGLPNEKISDEEDKIRFLVKNKSIIDSVQFYNFEIRRDTPIFRNPSGFGIKLLKDTSDQRYVRYAYINGPGWKQIGLRNQFMRKRMERVCRGLKMLHVYPEEFFVQRVLK